MVTTASHGSLDRHCNRVSNECPVDIAHIILFLASEEEQWVNGKIITLDDGPAWWHFHYCIIHEKLICLDSDQVAWIFRKSVHAGIFYCSHLSVSMDYHRCKYPSLFHTFLVCRIKMWAYIALQIKMNDMFMVNNNDGKLNPYWMDRTPLVSLHKHGSRSSYACTHGHNSFAGKNRKWSSSVGQGAKLIIDAFS